MSKTDGKGSLQVLLTKRLVFLITKSTQRERKEVSFSLPPPTKEENLSFLEKMNSEILYQIFFKATSRHLRLPKLNANDKCYFPPHFKD